MRSVANHLERINEQQRAYVRFGHVFACVTGLWICDVEGGSTVCGAGSTARCVRPIMIERMVR